MTKSFICRKNNSNVENFTDGKIYVGKKSATGSDICYTIKDDLGLDRFILSDGSKSPHLVYWNGHKGITARQKSVGWFEELIEWKQMELNF